MWKCSGLKLAKKILFVDITTEFKFERDLGAEEGKSSVYMTIFDYTQV